MRKLGAEFAEAHDLDEVFAHIFEGAPVDHPKDGQYFEGWASGTVSDIKRKLYQYGSLSPKQVELLKRLHEELHERQVEQAAEEARTVAIPAAIVGTRSTVEGTVLGTRVDEGYYGYTHKMLLEVEAEGGVFKLWGTVPSAIASIYDEDGNYVRGIEKGDRVTFTAKVEQSDDDEAFGFYSRPTKASIAPAAS
jgi:hypothetical protein